MLAIEVWYCGCATLRSPVSSSCVVHSQYDHMTLKKTELLPQSNYGCTSQMQ